MVGSVKLHHFISNKVAPSIKSDCMLYFLGNGSNNYIKFREERFPKKEKKHGDTLKRITVPQFLKKAGKLALIENVMLQIHP